MPVRLRFSDYTCSHSIYQSQSLLEVQRQVMISKYLLGGTTQFLTKYFQERNGILSLSLGQQTQALTKSLERTDSPSSHPFLPSLRERSREKKDSYPVLDFLLMCP